MRRLLPIAVLLSIVGVVNPVSAQFANILLQENFNGVTLGDSVNERRGPLSFAKRTVVEGDATTVAVPNAFTHTPPINWTIDNNFDNFGRTDLPNALGTDVIGINGEAGNLLYRVAQINRVVGNVGVGNQGSAADGVDEWEGWSFARKDFWSSVDQQGRESFALGSGTIAVADPDEYDDLGAGLGGQYYNTGMTTASIPVAGLPGVVLSFDSSWQPEANDDGHNAFAGVAANNQTAILYASFDGGTPVIVPGSIWNSDAGHTNEGPLDGEPTRPASGTFKLTALSENVSYFVNVPNGAQNVKFSFGLINAGNDWWWAVDNLAASDGVNPAFWTENFDSLTLQSSVNERVDAIPTFSRVTAVNNDPASTPRANSFSHTPPANWSVDNTGINPLAIGDNNLGVFEWEGWSFADRDFWTFADGQGRADFTKGTGSFAIADSDEFDDLGSTFDHDNDPNTPAIRVTQPMDTVLQTAVNVAGLSPSTLFMQFDSSWLPEDSQLAVITVDYGNGQLEALRWESDSNSPNFHGDNTNETVLIPLNNPAGASSATIRFKYLQGGNNWWWAVDNIVVGTVIPEPSSVALVLSAGLAVLAAGARQRRDR